MIQFKSTERKVDLYDIGEGLTLMNIIKKKQNGQISAVDTYIGIDKDGFSCVGHAEGLDEPGVQFYYDKYMNVIQRNLKYYLNVYYIKSQVPTP